MSCNGCRVLRKGCSDTCVLRSCLSWIDSAEAQGHATVFVAKFFGRAGMMSFINAVAENQRPAVFQSLLFEACGRTVNPVFGAVGLLWTGNWGLCQAAVDTVLKGGFLKPAVSASDTNSIQLQASPVIKRYSAAANAQESQPAITKKRIRNSIATVEKDHPQQQINNKVPRLDASETDESRTHQRPVILKPVDHQQSVYKAPVLDQQLQATAVVQQQICRNNSNKIEDNGADTRPANCGQLVAPKARRAVAAMGSHDPLISHIVSIKQQPQKQQQFVANTNPADSSPATDAHEAETVELGLALNFGAATAASHSCFTSRVPNVINSTTAAATSARTHSPASASISVNSEGSVTSSDTTDFSVSCFSAYNAKENSSQRLPQRQLLHLL